MHILFDIGKTKTRMAGSHDLVTFGEPNIFDTPKSYGDFLKKVEETAGVILSKEQNEKIESAAGGVGAPLEPIAGVLEPHPELPGWEGKPLREDLERVFNASVTLQNDSSVVGLGEALHGAGRGSSLVAYITISTGVGGARIDHGKIDANASGFEPGWELISVEGREVRAEEVLSGRGVEKATGKKPKEILDKDFWDEKAKILAHFLNNIIVMWSPDVVVLGGSMMNEIGIPIPATEKYLKEICTIFPELPPLKHSELGDLGGLWGAMELLKQGNY
ncbi:ROK family protein [bacterium]|nr:ROK family protein [bacterium]